MNQQQVQRFLLAIAMALASTAHHLSIAASNFTHARALLAGAYQDKNSKKTREAVLLECKEKWQWYQELVTPQDVRNVLALEDKSSRAIEASRQQDGPIKYEQYKYTNDYNTFAAIVAGLNQENRTRGIATLIKEYCCSIVNSPCQQSFCVAQPIAMSSPMQSRDRDSLMSPDKKFLVLVTDETRKSESSRMPMLIRQTDTLKQQAFDVNVWHSGICPVDGLWAPNSDSVALLPHSYRSFSSDGQDPLSMVHVSPAFSKVNLVSVAAHYEPDVTQWSWSPDSLLLAVPEAAGILKNRKRAINLITSQGAIQQQLICNPVCGEVVGVVLPVAWSVNNRYLAAACSPRDKTSGVENFMAVYIFNVATGALEQEITYADHAACIAWSRQGSVLAIANSKGDIDIYNVETKEQYCVKIVDCKGISRSRRVLQWYDTCLCMADDAGSTQIYELQPVYSASTGNKRVVEPICTDELFSRIIDIKTACRVQYLASPKFLQLALAK